MGNCVLKSKHGGILSTIEKEHDTKLQKLTDQIDSINYSKCTIAQSLENLQSQLDEEKVTRVNFQKEIDTLSTERVTLSKQHSDMLIDYTTLEDKYETLLMDYSNLKDVNGRYLHQHNQMKQEL